MCLVTETSFQDPTADPASLEQIEAERPDHLEHAVQGGLVELADDDGDPGAGAHDAACERRERGLIELIRDPDLVGGLSSHACGLRRWRRLRTSLPSC